MADSTTTKSTKGPKRARKTTTRKTSRRKAPGKLTAHDPATGKVLAEIAATPPGEVAEIVSQARKVQPEWAAIPPEGRARILGELRSAIYDRLDDIVQVVHEQTGKPRAEALAHDVLPVVLDLAYYERYAPKFLRPQRRARIAGPVLFGTSSTIELRPFGVVGVISPWNYPFSLGMSGVAPALFAGNTVVLKPSEVTPGVGEMLREVLDVLPAGVANVIQGGPEVGAALVDAPCDKICFIGSPAVGRKIAEAAAKHLTPVVMELGGMDPAIVLEDADLDVASSGVLFAAFANAGQTCCSSERAYIVDEVYDEFKDLYLRKLEKVPQLMAEAQIGPLTMKRQYDVVKRHVDEAVAKGATVLVGGPDRVPDNPDGAYWYPPTVLENVTEDMAICSEETFGPVLTLERVRDAEEAIRKANEFGFNLTASVYTRDPARASRVGHELRAGSIGINSVGPMTFGAPWAPWGGIGESGYGRIKGVEGLREFTYPAHVAKTIGPTMKSPVWYPYDAPTQRLVEGLTDAFGARDLRTKLSGAKRVLSGIPSAIKSKL